MTTAQVQIAALVMLALGIGTMAYAIAAQRQPVLERYGLRGVRRQKALDQGGAFASWEPMIRWLGARIAPLPFGGLRVRLDGLLVRAGHWYGVSADELIGMSLLSGFALTVAGAAVAAAGDLPGVTLFFFAGLGLVLPYTSVTGRVAARQKSVDRGLPAAIDLAALCMGAGLDFTATLRQLAEKSGRPDDALVEEIDIIISHLMLGVTRQRALLGFAERMPTDAVRQFVAAVIQSEEKGNPLAETLKLQAGTLRLRRSVRGEEAASRAAVMMMAPLMMIMGAIVLVVLGPFVVRGYLGG